MINTIKCDVRIEKYNISYPGSVEHTYNIIFRRRDNHWKADYVKHDYTPDKKSYTEEGVKEIVDDNVLDYYLKPKVGVIENKSGNIFLEDIIYGIIGIKNSSSEVEELYQQIKSGVYDKLEIDNIKHNGNDAIAVNLKRKYHSVKMVFSAAWKYTIPIVEITSGDENNNTFQSIYVNMKMNSSTGLWFPDEAQVIFKTNNEMIWRDKIIYTNVKLNEDITDKEINYQIPEGSNIINSITQENYHIRNAATLNNIISGKTKSIQQETKPKMSFKTIVSIYWHSLKSSLVFRILIVILFTLLIFLTITILKKRINLTEIL